MESCPTYQATIYMGLRAGYSDIVHSAEEAKALIQEYVNKVGLCVTLTETTFIYIDGEEPGLIIGLINYPRFPMEGAAVARHAETLAGVLMKKLQQNRVSIVLPGGTVMLENGKD